MTTEDFVEYLMNTPITRDFTVPPGPDDVTVMLRDRESGKIFIVRTMAKMHNIEDIMLVLQAPEPHGKMGTVWIRPLEHMVSGSLEVVS